MITRRDRLPFQALATITVVVLGASPAGAWGRLGHRAAARLAMSRLTPEAKKAVAELLEPGETLADASTWADEVRRDRPKTAPWHYVNVPITETEYDPKFCPEVGCVVSKIADFRRVLADRNAPKAERREALRWLVHLVEDMHQPVHVGHRNDRGGNDLQLRFYGEGTNLHRLWDSGILDHAGGDEDAWAAALIALATPERVVKWSRGTVEDWATESLLAARLAYKPPGASAELKAGQKLGDDYQDFALPIARRRLCQSGVRLADLINEALK
ncbi:MAG TPA: S1/P1 nuclease [Isosphaeraceae bacterium]|jgi:hypothetical protein|nr:S1/P1 nuclease [Isosphaeraceae bacterium]